MLPSHLQNPNPKIYLSDNYVVTDFETTTHDFGSAHNPENRPLMGWWFNAEDHDRPGWHYAAGDRMSYDALCKDIESADFMVAHNTKFELGWLKEMGLDIASTLPFCTRLAEMCIAGNRPWPLSLSDCLARRGMGGKDPMGRLIRLGVDTLDIPRRWLKTYCKQDVRQTLELFLDQREQLERDGLLEVAFTRNILTPVLWEIEEHGIYLDKDRVNLVWEHYANEQARLMAEWTEVTEGVNPNSGPQKRVLLYETLKLPPARDDQGKEILTDGGELATSEAALKALKCRNKKQKRVVALLLELASVNSTLSKYMNKLKECANNEQILHADFVQFSAGTHRLASKGRGYKIQLQNFQRLLKPLVKARVPGWKVGDGDAAGIEFRTAVDNAKDPQGLEDIANRIDVHANTASITKIADGWDPNLGPKEGKNNTLRQDAKADTFKPLYGGQSGTKVQRDYFAWFRERYSGVAKMQQGWAETVLATKQLRTASGLIFYWPGARLGHDGKYIKYTTQIYDYPIQSFATAEMCPTATVYLWHLMRAAEMVSYLTCLVHDSAVGEIHPEEGDQWAAYLQYCFNELIVWYLREVYAYEWTTPLESEVKLLEHWDDSEPKKWMAQWAQENKNGA